MNKNFKFISMVLTIVFCFSAMAFGQGTTGSIEGYIKDVNDAIIPNAVVKVESTGSTTGYNRTVTADNGGYIRIPSIPPGTYTVTVSAPNFVDRTATITVVVDKATTIGTILDVAGVGVAQVEIQASNDAQIDPTSTKIDTNITKQVIDALPKGTNFTSLLKAAPNVRPEALSGGFQIDGASGSENVFVIDGQEVTNFRTGTLDGNNNVPFELVQEVQIKSTGFGAEYGGATGGVINVVTSGGGDKFRGNFGASFRPSTVQGGPRPILSSFGSNGPGEFEQFNPPKSGGTDFFPVASISGPIIKKHLWFSTTYAPQYYVTDLKTDYFSSRNPAARSVTQSIDYHGEQKNEYAFARLDAQPFSKLRMFGTFLYNPIIVNGIVPGSTEGLGGAPQSVNFGGSTGTLTGASLLAQQGGRQNSNSVNGQITYTPTNNLVLNFRGGRSFLNERSNAYGLPDQTRFACSTTSRFADLPAGNYGCQAGFSNVASNFVNAFDVSTRTTFDADAALVGVNLGGRHNFKFGYQYNRLFNTVDQGYAKTGYVLLYFGRPISEILGTPATGVTASNPTGICQAGQTTNCNLGSGLLQRFGTVGEASSANTGLFAQDSWQIGNRLTFNLGVRIEKETVPSFSEDGQAIEFGWGDKIAPRFGVAFDLTGDGKTKLFASYGWFYDRFKYELPRGSFGGDFYRRDYFEILPSRGTNYTDYTFSRILGTTPDVLGGRCPDPADPTQPYPPLGNGFSVCQFDFRIPTNLVGADIFDTGAVDPNLKAARQSEYTFGLERELMRNFLFSGRYTHKNVDRAIEDVGVFNAAGSEAYIIGNPGFGLVCDISTDANRPCTKAERLYDALEIRVDRRGNKYFYNASYTLSRLFGNYSGLASSDEFGRTSPNVNRAFDLPFLGYTSNGDPDNGRLATDRPHVFKAYGGYNFDWSGSKVNRTSISAFTTIQSGTPLTTIFNLYNVAYEILNKRGDLGRTKTFSETDLNIQHSYKFGRDARFALQPYLNFRNVFDQKNVLRRNTTISTTDFRGGGATSALRIGGCTACTSEAAVIDTIFNGGGITSFVNAYLAARPETRTNTYNEPNSYQAPREVRFGFRFLF